MSIAMTIALGCCLCAVVIGIALVWALKDERKEW